MQSAIGSTVASHETSRAVHLVERALGPNDWSGLSDVPANEDAVAVVDWRAGSFNACYLEGDFVGGGGTFIGSQAESGGVKGSAGLEA
jgi:hypothetical protein